MSKQEYRVTESKRRQFYGDMRSRTLSALLNHLKTARQAVLSGSPSPENYITALPVQHVFTYLYTKVGVYFARNTYQQMKSENMVEVFTKYEDLVTEWDEFFKNYALTDVGTRIIGITDTSREIIRGIIAKAGVEGLTIDQTAKMLTTEFTTFSRYRARMIARTEIINASNRGSLLAAQATGLNVQKKWISTYDKRTRDDHRQANGKLADLNGEFEVGGELLSYPGDPKGSAENIINCRCAIGYKRY